MALTLFLAQFAAMAIGNGGITSMWPLGLLTLVVLSVPGMVAAGIGAWLRGEPGGGESGLTVHHG